MKTKTKNKKIGKVRKRPGSTSREKVILTHAKLPGLRHFRLINHKHTFKLIHHRHTSHLVLFIILIIVGFFIYASGSMVRAETSNSSVLVGAIVPGPPPDIGATITSPGNNATIKDTNIIDVSGTCYKNSFVIVKDNGFIVGSTACTDTGVFSLQVQVEQGKNVLSALNYDNINQVGPETPTTTIFITKTEVVDPTEPVDNNTPPPPTPTEIIMPVLPDNPSIITGVNSTFLSCNDYKPGKLSTGGELHVSIVCVPRLFLPNVQQVMGVLVWGGTPPYALSIDFGDDNDHQTTLLSLSAPGYTKVKFSYAVPGTYRIKFRLTDKKNETAIVQTAVQVNGEAESPIAAITNMTKEILDGKSWFESPVPFYLLAIAITLGFWGGDIFDRKYGAKNLHSRRKART